MLLYIYNVSFFLVQRARVTQLFGGDLPVSVFSVVESRVDMDSGMVPSGMPPDMHL